MKGETTTQTEIAKQTGIAQPHVSEILKSIRELSFVPKRVRTVLKALGWRIKIIKGSDSE